MEQLHSDVEKGRQRMSQHGLEMKIDRRGEELQEIENLIKEIFFDAADVRSRIEKEVEQLGE